MSTTTILPGATLEATRMPGHWLLARYGKQVLRPGGVELTRRLLDSLAIGGDDDVVEVAPGLGSTTEMVVASGPRSYTGIDRDPHAADRVAHLFAGPDRRVRQGTAAATGLDDQSASVVFGEAYLTMQPDSQKRKILAELARVLRPGGRFGLHEVAITPDDAAEGVRDRIARDLTSNIMVNVSPLPVVEWCRMLEDAGLAVTAVHRAPLHLLEPRRLVADEGLTGAIRFASRVLRDPAGRSRVLGMRSAMRRHADHLDACVIVAERR